jgi:hypothetical protein
VNAITTIQQALAPIVGLPLRCIGRAANLLWLHFGEMRSAGTRGGGTKTVGEWAIHVQCPWRICRHGHIVVACQDYYCSPGGEALDDDWDSPGKSRFDSLATILCTEFETRPPVVSSVNVDEVGGFSLNFNAGYRLDVFPADSNDSSEDWRVFQPGSGNKHFVYREQGTDAGSVR